MDAMPPIPDSNRRITVGDHELSLPEGHRLPRLRAMMPTYDAHLGWIIEALGRTDPDGCFIDIGANVGDTAAMLRAHAPNPLLCVEGHADYVTYLRSNLANLSGRAEVIEAFVHVTEIESAALTYRAGTGTGGFNAGVAEDNATAMIGVADLVAQAQARHGHVTLFKTDTDGLDGCILRDALRAPIGPAVLFFECDEANAVPEDGGAIWRDAFDALRRRGYSVIVYDNHGLPMLFAANETFAAVDDLRFYVRQQYAAGAVRVHYLDIWAFPPARRGLFETLRTRRAELFF